MNVQITLASLVWPALSTIAGAFIAWGVLQAKVKNIENDIAEIRETLKEQNKCMSETQQALARIEGKLEK